MESTPGRGPVYRIVYLQTLRELFWSGSDIILLEEKLGDHLETLALSNVARA